MRNEDFIDKYIETPDFKGACNHLIACNNELVNYSTTICKIDPVKHTADFNARKYSRTTGKIQSMLKRALINHGYKVNEYNGNDAYIWNYGYMGAPIYKKSDIKNVF